MLLTYRTGQEALAAMAESTSRNVGGEQLIVALQTPDWCSSVEREFLLTRSNTAESYAATSNSLLGEDFSMPSMSFDDMDGNCYLLCLVMLIMFQQFANILLKAAEELGLNCDYLIARSRSLQQEQYNNCYSHDDQWRH